jgi:hypothetical protein
MHPSQALKQRHKERTSIVLHFGLPSSRPLRQTQKPLLPY